MTGLVQRTRRGRAAADDGLTLVELLVTMILLGIVSTIVVTTVTVISRATVRDRSNGESLDLARIGMDYMTRAIRAGTEIQQSSGAANKPAFIQTGPEVMELYASLGQPNGPTRIRYAVDGNRRLIEYRCEANAGSAPYYTYPTWNYTGTPPSGCVAREIASQILSGTSPPLFTYVTGPGAPPAGTTAPGAAPTVSPQTLGAYPTNADLLGNIRGVDINLNVDSTPGVGIPVRLNNTVMLPNLGVLQP